jgi:hypothetical protein
VGKRGCTPSDEDYGDSGKKFIRLASEPMSEWHRDISYIAAAK